jgi:hypothetical protein
MFLGGGCEVVGYLMTENVTGENRIEGFGFLFVLTVYFHDI